MKTPATKTYARYNDESKEIMWIHRHTFANLIESANRGNDCNLALLDDYIEALQRLRGTVDIIKVVPK